jgi:hypothetical protein
MAGTLNSGECSVVDGKFKYYPGHHFAHGGIILGASNACSWRENHDNRLEAPPPTKNRPEKV